MEVHLSSILEASKSIMELDFSGHSTPFVNAILNTDDIVSLIRDAEAYEALLFTTTDTNGIPQRSNLIPPTPKSGRESSSSVDDMGVLVRALSRLLEIYPMNRASEILKQIKIRHENLNRSITELENTIDRQRREYHVLLNQPNQEKQEKQEKKISLSNSMTNLPISEQIKREEIEIVALESMMAERQERRDALDKELDNQKREKEKEKVNKTIRSSLNGEVNEKVKEDHNIQEIRRKLKIFENQNFQT